MTSSKGHFLTSELETIRDPSHPTSESTFVFNIKLISAGRTLHSDILTGTGSTSGQCQGHQGNYRPGSILFHFKTPFNRVIISAKLDSFYLYYYQYSCQLIILLISGTYRREKFRQTFFVEYSTPYVRISFTFEHKPVRHAPQRNRPRVSPITALAQL